jgi:hypothetical protein
MKISTSGIIARAESYAGIRAGVVSLAGVLKGTSYRAGRDNTRKVPSSAPDVAADPAAGELFTLRHL